MEGVKTNIDRLLDLPSIPVVIQKLQELIAKTDVSSHEVAKVVEADPPFVARLLKVVNSPFYGFRRKIASVEEAVTILGLNAVHQLLLATSLVSTFGTNQRAVNVSDFWQHSFGVGAIAKRLLYRASNDTQSEVFVCGILHDIGRLVFARNEPDKFCAIYCDREQVTDLTEEEEFFGIDHQKLGERLAQKWNFPESVITAIANHHTPMETPESYRKLTSAVHIADLLTHALHIGNSGIEYVVMFSPEAWHLLELSLTELEETLRASLKDIEQVKKMLNDIG